MTEPCPPTAIAPTIYPGEKLLHATIRSLHEDFLVEEIPRGSPTGEGEHLWIRIEKRGLDTFQAVEILARAAGISPRACGFAGRKDRRAVTRQWMSLPVASEDWLSRVTHPEIRILEVARSSRKIRLGWLQGNRFTIKLRGLEALEPSEFPSRIAARHGGHFPNAFGPQRFGRHQTNHLLGRALLRGDLDEMSRIVSGIEDDRELPLAQEARAAMRRGEFQNARFPRFMHFEQALVRVLAKSRDPMDLWRHAPRSELQLLVSAWQSEGFQRVLQDRLGQTPGVLEGDLMQFTTNDTLFYAEDLSAETIRFQAGVAGPTGPMSGSRMPVPKGEALLRESAALSAWWVSDSTNPWLKGERRALFLKFPEVQWSHEEKIEPADSLPEAIRLSFALREGSFATVLLAALGIQAETD